MNPDNIKNCFTAWLKKECVLVIATLCAAISSIFASPQAGYIDFKVLILLFNLMLIVAAFKQLSLLDFAAISIIKKCSSSRSLYFAMTAITFMSSMLVTNDVALITFVPLTLIIAQKVRINALNLIVIQTLAANLGSSLTPVGNPQNLFIYSFYDMNIVNFFEITLPLVLVSTLLLLILILREKNHPLELEIKQVKIESIPKSAVYAALFVTVLLSVFHVIPYMTSAAAVWACVLFLDRKLFAKVDYSLLLTFVAFFIFIGNISNMQGISGLMKSFLDTGRNTFLAGLISSQFISNVPAAILISNFTPYYRELIMGVNIGGMGTLIASLASVISYKLYVQQYPAKHYMRIFSLYNTAGLLLMVPFAMWLIGS